MSLWMSPCPARHSTTATKRHQPLRWRVTLLLVLSTWLVTIFYAAHYTQTTHERLAWQNARTSRHYHKVGVLTAYQPFDDTRRVQAGAATSVRVYKGESLQDDYQRKSVRGGNNGTLSSRDALQKISRFHEYSNRAGRDKSLKFIGRNGAAVPSNGRIARARSGRDVTRTVQSNRTKENYVEFALPVASSMPAKKVVIPGRRSDPPREGEFGQPVIINEHTLSQKDREMFDLGWKTHHFNEFVSLQISHQREVPDYRNSECQKEADAPDDDTHLPKASIIVCFYNEAWSVLLRSVYSILLRSPAYLVEEIILVDDFSDLDSLQKPLQQFVSRVDKLRLLRMRSRSGLVKARLAGVKEAKGTVLVFLDSHVECQKGWLKPLLQTIARNPTHAVTPEIDVIDEKLFSIHRATDNIGVLDFKSFSFTWTAILPRIKRTVHSKADPIPSPTMAGGLFAINKKFFLSLGMYDPHLQLWGGENIELSLKLWMCGGGILVHPCSRVSHIFRNSSPYLTGGKEQVAVVNSARVAYVWADEYRSFFFNDAKFKGSPAMRTILDKVEDRMKLREQLKCKTFSWFHQHVYPELYIEGSGKFLGPIKSPNGLCITATMTSSHSPLFLGDCRLAVSWEYSRIGEIRGIDRCVDVPMKASRLYAATCDLQTSSQLFHYLESKQLYHPESHRCLATGEDGVSIVLRDCNGHHSLLWEWMQNSDHVPYDDTAATYQFSKVL